MGKQRKKRFSELQTGEFTVKDTNVTAALDGLLADATELNTMDGITSTTAELNILDGVTADAAELNTMDGITATTAELNILDTVTATADELNLLDNQPASATFVVNAEDTNAITVNVQILDAAGVDMATAVALQWYLADDTLGLDRAVTAPDGGAAAGTDGSLHISTTGMAGGLTTEADGDFDIIFTEAAADTWYLVIVMPNGSLQISEAITFA